MRCCADPCICKCHGSVWCDIPGTWFDKSWAVLSTKTQMVFVACMTCMASVTCLCIGIRVLYVRRQLCRGDMKRNSGIKVPSSTVSPDARYGSGAPTYCTVMFLEAVDSRSSVSRPDVNANAKKKSTRVCLTRWEIPRDRRILSNYSTIVNTREVPAMPFTSPLIQKAFGQRVLLHPCHGTRLPPHAVDFKMPGVSQLCW